MPNLPISQLPSASALTGAETVATVQGGVTKQTTLSAIIHSPTNNYGLFAQTGSSIPVTNTVTESSLLDGGIGTLSVPANGFSIGDSFHIVLTGHLSAINNNTLHIRIKSDGVLLASTNTLTLAGTTNKHWKLEVFFTIRNIGGSGTASIVSGGTFIYNKDAGNAFEGTTFSNEVSTGFDTTIPNTLVITAQWGAANVGNSIYSDIAVLNKTY